MQSATKPDDPTQHEVQAPESPISPSFEQVSLRSLTMTDWSIEMT